MVSGVLASVATRKHVGSKQPWARISIPTFSDVRNCLGMQILRTQKITRLYIWSSVVLQKREITPILIVQSITCPNQPLRTTHTRIEQQCPH